MDHWSKDRKTAAGEEREGKRKNFKVVAKSLGKYHPVLFAMFIFPGIYGIFQCKFQAPRRNKKTEALQAGIDHHVKEDSLHSHTVNQ